MRRILIVAAVAAAAAILLSILSLYVPTYATRLVESGEPISLPSQVLIAAGNFWRRWGPYLMLALVLVLGAWAFLTRPRTGAAG